ncbi:hypothetical protein SASPL_137619 [Salvia splendens]|uniref:Uncharacterized protein n=1 Tax=Salvia splendens TaxID=180675 RepID=A0A8X8WTP5_SALSN|nr:hypothetical protein SASPL_137619 [Salvia splendens]
MAPGSSCNIRLLEAASTCDGGGLTTADSSSSCPRRTTGNPAWIMEEQNHKKYLPFRALALDWLASNASGSLSSNFDSDQYYIMAAGSGACQWMHSQPTPQNYIPFLSETGHTEIQKQMEYDVTAQCPAMRLQNPSQLEEYMRLHNCGDFVTSVTGLEELVEIRKLRISHWLDALQELVPSPEGVGQAALLDGVVDHIEYLQYQMKFEKNAFANDLYWSDQACMLQIFVSFESLHALSHGHGHYFLEDQMLDGPLEEMIGKLIKGYPSAAAELLQSRGLIVLPMTFAE